MQNQHIPVLILAQSGRFLSQSASQAGYPVWVADCFGDQDTLSCAQRWQALPPLSELTQTSLLETLSEITNGEDCTLICGSGIESYYGLLTTLPNNIHLVGNSAHTINIIKTPILFFGLLKQLRLPYPDTQFMQPVDDTNWLIKSPKGLGGNHVKHLNRHPPTTECYFQRHITGSSGSALFLANGIHAQLLSINKQTLRPYTDSPFRLGAIEKPWAITEAHRHQLEEAICKISSKTGLLGLNSLDFIISEQGELLLLEINPRPSASAELIGSIVSIFHHHINACHGSLPDKPIIDTVTKGSLRYLYARHNYRIPSDVSWPSECHDLPAAGTLIKKHAPICTSILMINEDQPLPCKLHDVIENKIIEQLSSQT
ncbi:MAG: ATP-grasp domain-containing protein [Gammaproteobacteria bacterium]|nr:ATP-grasp domain-containing protein [Gammaproteobacteria bacterium]MDH5592359.1 ATP-grasp domain-containing protein [Gammaproteobacteria bacterium]